MWRRVSTKLQTLAPWRSAFKPNPSFPFAEKQTIRNCAVTSASTNASSTATSPFQKTSTLDADTILGKGRKSVEDVMPIATGHEREEIEAELQGRNLAEMDYPVGPFGTKEAPAIVKSIFDKRIVGCPGGEGEDEHDVVWFWLEKGKPHECPVCSQYFMLEVVGPGGSPDGHNDEDHH